MSGLGQYRAKRDAARTPEPVPEFDPPADFEWGRQVDHTGDEQAGRGDRFVVQEHHATALHWDVRLERDGVLVSWAVPRGIPPDPTRNHLAVKTEDHPLEYLDFHGEIPAGQYGAGTMKIWDRGTYEVHKFRDRE
ncbi:MAG: DNA polymerase ligase N-terminal domain-containing protein, partial [Pseudonocardiaceae bacterium]